MPLFEYRCDDCSRESELLVRVGEPPVCPQCRGQKLQKLMSHVAARVSGKAALPVVGEDCPPPSAGPCGTRCCRLPQ